MDSLSIWYNKRWVSYSPFVATVAWDYVLPALQMFREKSTQQWMNFVLRDYYFVIQWVVFFMSVIAVLTYMCMLCLSTNFALKLLCMIDSRVYIRCFIFKIAADNEKLGINMTFPTDA